MAGDITSLIFLRLEQPRAASPLTALLLLIFQVVLSLSAEQVSADVSPYSGLSESTSASQWQDAGFDVSKGYAITAEGAWIKLAGTTVHFEGFSPAFFLTGLGFVSATKLFSHISPQTYKSLKRLPFASWLSEHGSDWLHWGGQLAGLGSGGWYLSSSYKQWQRRELDNSLVIEQPLLSSRLLMQTRSEPAHTTVSFIASPLASSPREDEMPEKGTLGDVEKQLLTLFIEMNARQLERIDIKLFHGSRGAQLQFSWRDANGDVKQVGSEAVFGRDAQADWLELSLTPKNNAISVLQPRVLSYIQKLLMRGHSAGLGSEIFVPPLLVDTAKDAWSTNLQGDARPFIIGGSVRDGRGVIENFKLLHGSEQPGALATGSPERMIHVPATWVSLVEAGMQLISLGYDFRFAESNQTASERVLTEPVISRLSLLKEGKTALVGIGAAVSRTIQGEPRQYRVERMRMLKDSNRVAIPESLENDLMISLNQPWVFELTGTDARKGWAAMEGNERSPHNNTIYMSKHMMNGLQVKPGDEIAFQPVKLDPLREVVFEVLNGPKCTEEKLLNMLTNTLPKRYPTLHKGEVLRWRDSGHDYSVSVSSMVPDGAAFAGEAKAIAHIKYPDHWGPYITGRQVEAGEIGAFLTKGFELGTGMLAPPITREEQKRISTERLIKSRTALTHKDLEEKFQPFTGQGFRLGKAKAKKK